MFSGLAAVPAVPVTAVRVSPPVKDWRLPVAPIRMLRSAATCIAPPPVLVTTPSITTSDAGRGTAAAW